MRIYIMTDLEGVSGVQDSSQWCNPRGRYYDMACELLTREVNAAIEGFLTGDAAEILVADGHGSGALIPGLLHRSAELARNWPAGRPYPFSMDSRPFDVAAWIGQHPKAGTGGGHLCHTGNMGVRDQTINGQSVGEFGEGVFSAWELGIRVIFATGCEAFTQEARALVPGIETVAVKRGLQTDPGHNLPAAAYREHNVAAIHSSVASARERIAAGALHALARARKESFGAGTPPAAPYRRVQVMRNTDTQPPRMLVSEHPDSIIALLNQTGQTVPIDYDPLRLKDKELTKTRS